MPEYTLREMMAVVAAREIRVAIGNLSAPGEDGESSMPLVEDSILLRFQADPDNEKRYLLFATNREHVVSVGDIVVESYAFRIA